MKFRNLLIVGTVLFAGTSVTAQVTERQKPVPQKSALQYGKAMYLYNVGSKQFFKGANDWNTRGSVGEAGYKVWLTRHLEGGAWDNKTVIFKDSVETQKAIKMVWQAANGDVWVDCASQADTLWTIIPQNDNVYRLAVGAGNPNYNTGNSADMFLGTKAAEIATNTRVYWNLAAGAESFVDWYFVTATDYAAYQGAWEVYDASVSLKAVLDEARTKGVNVSAQEAVYNNAASTKEQMEQAIKDAKTAIAAAEEGKVTADSPVDKTSLIVNPGYDANKNDGWKGDAPEFQSYTDAEHYDKNYNTYQDIEFAPKGVYALSVSAFYRSGNTDAAYNNFKNNTGYNAKLYAKAGTDSLNANIMNPFKDARTSPTANGEIEKKDGNNSYYVPNNMSSAAEYFKLGLYAGNRLFFATEDGKMRIGIKKAAKIGADWTLFDNWKLTYYGDGADAYTLWLKDVKDNAKVIDETKLVTKTLVDDYKAYVSGLSAASNRAEVLSAIATLETKAADIDSNMVAWAAYQEALAKGKIVANDDKVVGQDKDELADYVDLESEDILNALVLTTEEVKAETEKLQKMIDDAVKNGITEGADVSDKYLVNANFEKTNGWVKKAADGGNVNYGGNSANHCYEAWNNRDFDIYQEVSDAPVGVYELSVQGFYRYGRGDNAYNNFTAGTASNDAVSIYVNNNTTRFKSVFEEKVAYSGNKTGELYKYEGGNPPYINPDSTYWYPNDMAVAATAFANGLYKVSSFGVVAKQGDKLRVGVKGNTGQLNDSWAIWDNFKMVFQGTKAEVVKPLLESEKETGAAVAATGDVMGTNAKAYIDGAISAAGTALAGNDGPTMFAALTELLNAKDSVGKSVALFKTLAAKRDELSSAAATSAAVQATKDEAGNVLEAIIAGLDVKNLTDAQAKDYVAKVDELVAKLAIPAEAAGASDENPVDLTSAIKTPGYEKNGANSVEGWNGTGYNFGNDDTQKGQLLLEFFNKKFDHNQTIIGLPNGTYQVKVNAFYRFGNGQEDYDKYTADNNISGNAFMYAVAGGDSLKTSVKLLASGARDTDPGYTGVSRIGTTGKYVPNDMVSANAYFLDGDYQNSLIVKVTDGKLTIGIRQDVKVDNDWVIMDNWTLTYFGKNSIQEPTAIEGVEDNASAVAKTEYFNLNGAKKNGLTQGINIVKMTMKDGAVKVSKVIVK